MLALLPMLTCGLPLSDEQSSHYFHPICVSDQGEVWLLSAAKAVIGRMSLTYFLSLIFMISRDISTLSY